MSILDLDSELQEFKNSGELYKQIFNCSVLPVIIHDMYFNIIDINDKAVAEFGYSKEEFLGLQVFDLHPKSELEPSLRVLEKMKKQDSMTVKATFVRKDGSLFLAEAIPCKIDLKRSSLVHVHLQKIESRS